MKREYWENLGLERELVNLIMAENGRDIEAFKARAETAAAERDALAARLADTESERDRMLAEQKATSDAALSEQKAGFDRALADAQSKYESALTKSKLSELFDRAGFACAFTRDAAVERFIAEGGAPDNAGVWLTALRKSEPGAFARPGAGADLPRFSAQVTQSDDCDARAGGLLGMLKKLR